MGKAIPGREIFILKQPKNRSSKQKAEGERGRELVPPKPPPPFLRLEPFKSELFLFKDGYTRRQNDGRFLNADDGRPF